MKIINLKSVDSTNEYCKRYGFGEDIIVTAVRQTRGKGTKGRSFVSDEGGLYCSVMRRFSDFLAVDAFKIMVSASVAVCRTVEKFGAKPIIRWANDVLVNGRKICGTLIENTFSGSYITRSIVGMGINVNNALPEELKDIATSLSAEIGKKIPVAEVRDELIRNLRREYPISEYKKYINWFGNEVILRTADREYTATAVDVDVDGSLICVIGGTLRKITSAEVSLRL